jgi:hypothetical protein
MYNYSLIDKFLEAIFPLPAHFGILYSNSYEDTPIKFSELEQAIHDVDPEAEINYGISKMAILSPNLDNVVIKIPFNGSFSKENEIYVWYPFESASGSDIADYCLAEYEKYNSLKTYGLDCFVAKTIFYKTIDNFRIFLQEEVTPECNYLSALKPSERSKKLAKEWKDKRNFYYSQEWLASCFDAYGEDKVAKLFDYYNQVDSDILQDLHDGNIGYRIIDKSPAILDYSNFMD